MNEVLADAIDRINFVHLDIPLLPRMKCNVFLLLIFSFLSDVLPSQWTNTPRYTRGTLNDKVHHKLGIQMQLDLHENHSFLRFVGGSEASWGILSFFQQTQFGDCPSGSPIEVRFQPFMFDMLHYPPVEAK